MADNKSEPMNISQWWGGMSDDVLEQSVTDFYISKHFDTVASANELNPYRATIADEDKTFQIENFTFANTSLWGLGRNTAGTKTKLYTSNFPATGWVAATTGESTNTDTKRPDTFEYYQGALYGFRLEGGVNHIWQYVIATNTFSEDFGVSTSTSAFTAPAFVHPISDRLFLPSGNILCQVDSGVFTDNVLVLPSQYIITSLTAWGDSLAIAVQTTSLDIAESRVYLWNMIDADPYEMISWGQENLKILQNIDNQLVGVSISSTASFAASYSLNMGLTLKTWSGGDVILVKNIPLDAVDYTLGFQKRFVGNSLYFALAGTTQTFTGIWRVGRKNESYPFQITIDRKVDNDNSVTSIQGHYKLGDYVFVAHSGDGSVDHTSTSATFTATSFVETQKYDGKNPFRKKQLRGVALAYSAFLPSAGQPVIKYRKDEETSYTTIFTETTDNAMSTAQTAITATQSLPDYYQIQFRVESTGGAKINQIYFIWDWVGGPFE